MEEIIFTGSVKTSAACPWLVIDWAIVISFLVRRMSQPTDITRSAQWPTMVFGSRQPDVVVASFQAIHRSGVRRMSVSWITNRA